ncbi:MAG: hypothetical protein HKN32_10250 [Flavobacteriales bacterium]|nr:hypothetical protein [Flavobacteriales bacterium]
MVLFPLFWAFESWVVGWLTGLPGATLLTLIAAPICGIIATDVWRDLRFARQAKRTRKWLQSDAPDAQTAREMRKRIQRVVENISNF